MSAASGGGGSAVAARAVPGGPGGGGAAATGPTISTYDCIVSVMTRAGPTGGMVISRLIGTKPRSSTRIVQTPSSSAVNRKAPSAADVVVRWWASCGAVTVP